MAKILSVLEATKLGTSSLIEVLAPELSSALQNKELNSYGANACAIALKEEYEKENCIVTINKFPK